MKTTYERVIGRFNDMKKGELKLLSDELRIMVKAVCEEFDSITIKSNNEEYYAIKNAHIRYQCKKVYLEAECPYCNTVKNVKWNDDIEFNQEKCGYCGEQFMVVKEEDK